MHEDLVDVLATDLAVTALAVRDPVDTDDPALRLLEAWAADIDAHPVAVVVEGPVEASTRRRPRGALRSIAVMTLALTVSSTGIAAAVQGNPFAPISFVVDKFGQFGHPDRPPSIDLFGGRTGATGNTADKDGRARAAEQRRPARSQVPDQTTSPTVPAPVPAQAAEDAPAAPIVAHRVPHSRGGGQVQEPREPRQNERQKPPLVVRHPHPPVRKPPSGGQTPPHRPELPGIPVQETPRPDIQKPPPGERPPPPDQPTPADPDSSMPSE
jgi:hypothetical protein